MKNLSLSLSLSLSPLSPFLASSAHSRFHSPQIKKLVRKGKFAKIPLKPDAPGKDDAAKKKR